ncbi:MAG: hypothetical protein V4596_08505 [Bdellovibrionota bacterium]
MNYVSFLFAMALVIANSANASEQKSVSFDYNNTKAYYSCSYAEAQMAKVLTAIGATEVSTDCSGGIDNDQLWPVSVDANFSHDLQGGKAVVLKGNESCDFNVKLIKAVLSTVDHEVVKAQDNCWDADGSFKYEVYIK